MNQTVLLEQFSRGDDLTRHRGDGSKISGMCFEVFGSLERFQFLGQVT